MNMLKELGPPNDICIQHEEWRTYMVGGTSQSRFGNAYYHASIACVHLVWPSFQLSMLASARMRREGCVCVCVYVCMCVYVCPHTLFWQYARLKV